MDCLIHSNSARETISASTRGIRYQYESPYSGAPGSSKFPTVAPLSTSGYSRTSVTSTTIKTLTRGHGHWGRNNLSSRNRKAEYSQTSDVTEQYDNIMNAITTLPNRLQATNPNHKLQHTQVPLSEEKRSGQWIWTLAPQPSPTIQQSTYRRSENSKFPQLTAWRGDTIFSVTSNIHGNNINRCVG